MLRAIFFGYSAVELREPINELGVTAAIARNWLVRSRPPSLTAFGSS